MPVFSPNDFYLAKDGFWYFRLTTPGGVRRSGVCTYERSRKEAIRMISETGVDRMEHLAKARMVTDEAIALVTAGRAGITVNDVFTAWREWIPSFVSYQTGLKYIEVAEHMIRFLGCADHPIGSLTEERISEFMHSSTHKGTRDPTAQRVKKRRIQLTSFFNYAQAKGHIRGNPLALVAIRYNEMTVAQKKERKPPGPFTPDEYARLLAGTTDFWHDAIVLGWCCGFRISDVMCLERASLRTDGITIYPKKANTDLPLAMPFSDPLLNRPELIEVNARLMATIPETQTFCFPDRQRHYVSAVEMDRLGLFFEFPRILKDCGVEKKGRGFHSLRRAFAQRLRGAGYSIDEVAERMGHSDGNVTRIYTGEEKVGRWPIVPARKGWANPGERPAAGPAGASADRSDAEEGLTG